MSRTKVTPDCRCCCKCRSPRRANMPEVSQFKDSGAATGVDRAWMWQLNIPGITVLPARSTAPSAASRGRDAIGPTAWMIPFSTVMKQSST